MNNNKLLTWMMTSAIVLTFGQPALADGTGRTVNRTFEFSAVGQGDLSGVCVNQPANPPQLAPLGSCVAEAPAPGDDHVTFDVRDSAGNPVYFTVQQYGNPNFGFGCGQLTSHTADPDHPSEGGAFPINDRTDVLVVPWGGPGLNTALEPGGSVCLGTSDTNLVYPGAVGTVRFIFHDEVAPSNSVLTVPFEFYALGQGDLTGVCINQPTNPQQLAPLGSCVEVTPAPGDDHVTIDVRDSQGKPAYFTVQQDGGGFGWGCGTLTSHPGGAFPILGAGAGGGAAPPVLVYPWAGPGLNDALDPGGSVCPGSLDPYLVLPGRVGTVTFIFHNEIAS
jgi:hypothetical protein